MKKILVFLVILMVGYVLGFSTSPFSSKFFAGNKEEKKQEVPVVNNENKVNLGTPEEKARMLADLFEKLHMERNPTKLLALFTPPKTIEEANEYMFIMGLDLPLPVPRLFLTARFTYKVISYKIVSIKLSSNKTFVEIEETRSGYDNMGGGWLKSKMQTMILEVEAVGINAMVSNYYEKDRGVMKYGGFY